MSTIVSAPATATDAGPRLVPSSDRPAKHVLFLAHRIPYPPNKGDKIRSYQLLKQLAGRYLVSLAAFVDNADDWRFRSELEALCDEVCLLPLGRYRSTLRSWAGLWAREPLTLAYYWDKRMAGWVEERLDRGVDAVLVFSSSMAQYVPTSTTGILRIVDFVDLDSEKWRQYGERRKGPMGYVYRREAALLGEYEREIALRFHHSLFVSQSEAEPLLGRCSQLRTRLHVVSNGVDSGTFDPVAKLDNPYAPGSPVVVFTGAMDYEPNADAVCWFANEAWPSIMEVKPNARFFVVGSRPATAVRMLARRRGIEVTGTVPDVRPYLKHAAVAVAPMRMGRGVQNKILEAMAMGLPVIATGAAVESLSRAAAACIQTAETGAQFAAAVLALIDAPDRENIAQRNRQAILDDYDWDRNLRFVFEILEAGNTGGIGEDR